MGSTYTLTAREAAVIGALRAIIVETSDYPQAPRYSHDSYLPNHFIAAAQTALAIYDTTVSTTTNKDAQAMLNPAKEIETEKNLSADFKQMHSLASSSLSRIRGVAKCALFSLETKSAVNDLEALAEALQAMIEDASLSLENVDDIAESHGVPTFDESWSNRSHAQRRASGA